jgi:hypothetical protein
MTYYGRELVIAAGEWFQARNLVLSQDKIEREDLNRLSNAECALYNVIKRFNWDESL